jgi:dihydroxyacetone kinase-like protein
VGDKTMIDVLEPAVQRLKELTGSGAWTPAVLTEVAVLAEARARSTAPLQARKGRASYLGERSQGHQDPGATSTAYLFLALAQSLAP